MVYGASSIYVGKRLPIVLFVENKVSIYQQVSAGENNNTLGIQIAWPARCGFYLLLDLYAVVTVPAVPAPAVQGRDCKTIRHVMKLLSS